MKLIQTALCLLLLSTPSASAEQEQSHPQPLNDNPPLTLLSPASPMPAEPTVLVNPEGQVTIDGKTFTERHPGVDKAVIAPAKKILKPVAYVDRVSRFKKLRSVVSDFIIVAGKKFEPYEPAAGAVITGTQIANIVVGTMKR